MDKHIFHVRFHTNMPRQLNSGIQNYTLTREEFGIQLQNAKELALRQFLKRKCIFYSFAHLFLITTLVHDIDVNLLG